ncbi:glycerol-3-phosphate responsive antiterminator [Tissierella sp. Yu-01]|uniref:glycerol-3-phosphate responsive antiterminator n=1 Tax=Tissierella sp. Yu-01 TaxID=3035694 RepID=UPI00240D1346|nr:glycerol-3-phosphate responsive antiterminator [Tissierella sp. Yu-01]WFA08382.1 glycerol-3-phosphate responsive antiterminator [Tissierella sp. Yu-01]
MTRNFFTEINDNPIIAAINDLEKIEDVIKSPCKIVFLLMGDILNIGETIKLLRKNDKLVFVHIDLIGGFSKDITALKYINNTFKPDGIITTKSNLIKAAKELRIFTIQRLFLLDSLSLVSGINSVKCIRPDAIEVLPGIMSNIIREIKEETQIPVVAGGLIRYKVDVIESLNAGAVGISTSREEVWYM